MRKDRGTKRLNLLDGCSLPCVCLKFNVGGATKGKGRSGVLRLLLHKGNGSRNVVFPDLSELEILKKNNFGHEMIRIFGICYEGQFIMESD